ncbi:BZ3500_MvSof-1268-A1-R1_Chr11-1g03136 [Microbotryum saponariae]|uniref:BZ3500_MvSof-1268-A1-R1_Chr11-1g03136 protein n=1 Tax=Microbotryum saponariae TaxID=289078 RepID=A0A2X0LCF7_9BASI|nr:BZ3501_MvSof-1269-A2-R1_Chr11g02711 [Microbotryum saponariae]SDA03696.1 BZ3500_MvSof-1268-A1-R1_Chr11-1g03136 [Microbotryum saponariae]
MPGRPTASHARPARPGRVLSWMMGPRIGVNGARADELGRCVGSDWVAAGAGGASVDETRRIDCAWAGGGALDICISRGLLRFSGPDDASPEIEWSERRAA